MHCSATQLAECTTRVNYVSMSIMYVQMHLLYTVYLACGTNANEIQRHLLMESEWMNVTNNDTIESPQDTEAGPCVYSL